MPNSLRLLPPAQRKLFQVDAAAREGFFRCFEYIRKHPEPLDPERFITAVPLPPAILYSYDDGVHVIEYYAEQDVETLAFTIEVWAIGLIP